MIKTLRRWIANIKWLFNHPPLDIVGSKDGEVFVCSYCGSKENNFNFAHIGWTICHSCMKRTVDRVLMEDGPEKVRTE